MFDLLGLWSNASKNTFILAAKQLAESLHSYSSYLKKSQQRMNPQKDTSRSGESIIQPIEPIDNINPKYEKANKLLQDKGLYEPVLLDNDINNLDIPDDRKERYKWFIELRTNYR